MEIKISLRISNWKSKFQNFTIRYLEILHLCDSKCFLKSKLRFFATNILKQTCSFFLFLNNAIKLNASHLKHLIKLSDCCIVKYVIKSNDRVCIQFTNNSQQVFLSMIWSTAWIILKHLNIRMLKDLNAWPIQLLSNQTPETNMFFLFVPKHNQIECFSSQTRNQIEWLLHCQICYQIKWSSMYSIHKQQSTNLFEYDMIDCLNYS